MKRFYLCSYIGSGKFPDSFRPALADLSQEFGSIDLRRDTTRAVGKCPAVADTSSSLHNGSSIILLTDDLIAKSTAMRNIVNSVLGLSLTSDTFPALMFELLTQGVLSKSQFCKPLVQGIDGKYRIILGAQIYGPPLPVYRKGTITESFPGSSATLGGDLVWTETQGTWANVSGVAQLQTTGGVEDARAESALSTDDHYAQLAVTALGTGTNPVWLGPAVRFAAAARTYYVTFPYQGDDKQYIEKIVTGTETALGSTAITVTIPGTFKISADASLVTGYQDGTQRVQVTDTAITGNLRTGIAGYCSSSSWYPSGDNFQASDLVAGAAFVPKFIGMI